MRAGLVKALTTPYSIIVAGACLSHGLLLLNDGIYWDGWLVYHLRQANAWPTLIAWSTEAGGVPFPFFLRWALGAWPGVIFGFRLAAFGALTLAAILVYAVATEVELWEPTDRLFVALLSLVYPAYQVAIEINTTKYLITYSVFLLAALLALRAERAAGIQHWSQRLLALGGFFLAFGTSSLLVWYLAFLLIQLVWFGRVQGSRLPALITRYMVTHVDYLLWPALYSGLSRWLFPAAGVYAEDNAISFSWASLVDGYRLFVQNALAGQWAEAFQGLLAGGLLGGAAGCAVMAGVFVWSGRHKAWPVSNRQAWAGLGVGGLLLLLGMLPYVLVGKPAALEGWNTRHALLVGLPLAVIIVGAVRLGLISRGTWLRPLGWAALTGLVWVFALATIAYYTDWQARWVKDQSVMLHLGKSDDLRRFAVLWIDDRYPVGGEPYYRFYEWAGIFKQVWGDEAHIGLDLNAYDADFLIYGRTFFTERYLLANFDPTGCQAQLAIRPGSGHVSNGQLAVQYLAYKYFQPAKLADFLAAVTTITISPAAGSEAAPGGCEVRAGLLE